VDWASWIGPRKSPMDFLKFIFSFSLRDKLAFLIAIGFLSSLGFLSNSNIYELGKYSLFRDSKIETKAI
jgi:hypothetical protein